MHQRVVGEQFENIRGIEEDIKKLYKISAPLREMSSLINRCNLQCSSLLENQNQMETKFRAVYDSVIPSIKTSIELNYKESCEEFKVWDNKMQKMISIDVLENRLA